MVPKPNGRVEARKSLTAFPYRTLCLSVFAARKPRGVPRLCSPDWSRRGSRRKGTGMEIKLPSTGSHRLDWLLVLAIVIVLLVVIF